MFPELEEKFTTKSTPKILVYKESIEAVRYGSEFPKIPTIFLSKPISRYNKNFSLLCSGYMVTVFLKSGNTINGFLNLLNEKQLKNGQAKEFDLLQL